METKCNICPRNCGVFRTSALGFCGAKHKAQISKVMLHHFEEPIISGEADDISHGSGTIFFSGCTLKCCYCQNSEISNSSNGKSVSSDVLASLFKQLEDAGAYNINLVTPTHFTDAIIEALKIYRPKIPIVWNTSGYETPETIKKLKPYVDIYLTDFKYFDSKISQKYSLASNYPENAKLSILEMRKNQPKDIIKSGLMQKGLIVRHLALPSHTKDSLDVIDWVSKNLGNKTYFSLMSQYVPMANAKNHPEINRKITALEYKILCKKLLELGFDNAFVQEHSSAESTYTPNFNEETSDFVY